MSKIKATEKQLKHIYDVLEKEEIGYLQQTMNEWFPELFEPKLEVGNWYKHNLSGALLFIDSIANGYSYGYGFESTRIYNDELSYSSKYLIPAAESEVFEALKNEFHKKYKGESFNNVDGDCFNNFVYNKGFRSISYCTRRNSLYVSQEGVGGQDVFRDGIWAEIVEQPKEQSINLHEVIKAFQKANPNTTIIIDPQ